MTDQSLAIEKLWTKKNCSCISFC